MRWETFFSRVSRHLALLAECRAPQPRRRSRQKRGRVEMKPLPSAARPTTSRHLARIFYFFFLNMDCQLQCRFTVNSAVASQRPDRRALRLRRASCVSSAPSARTPQPAMRRCGRPYWTVDWCPNGGSHEGGSCRPEKPPVRSDVAAAVITSPPSSAQSCAGGRSDIHTTCSL